ncbi:GPW/gp25 family protein [Phormidesmis sp. 146-35]
MNAFPNHALMGFAFPFRITNGGIERSQGFDKIEDNVRHLLSTRLGERVMLRTYGGGVHHRLQAPNSTTLGALIKHEIEQALRTYMPEVKLTAPIRIRTVESELSIVVEYTAAPQDVIRRLELQIP